MDPRYIRIDNYNYPLPDEQIAKYPLARRDSCRLLRYENGISDYIFSELPDLIASDSMLVYNNTRVINARLRFTKDTGATIEIFCLEPFEPADYESSFAAKGSCEWTCLVGNSKRWKGGALELPLNVSGKNVTLRAERIDSTPGELSTIIRFSWNDDALTFSEIISAAGEIPIPPYLNRKSEQSDASDYQTIYSHIEGSVAAPTAGLHFTPELMERLKAQGVKTREVTLHVGAGTFRPVKTDTIGEHDMHSEFIAVSRDFIIELADNVGKHPVIAVGTTSVRTLESLYHIGVAIKNGTWEEELDQWAPYAQNANVFSAKEALDALIEHLDSKGAKTLFARTRIIIAPSYQYRIVNGMITNFHQPQSTLLLLVSAFVGDNWRKIYEHALAKGYRFLSYGDACLLFPNTQLNEKN